MSLEPGREEQTVTQVRDSLGLLASVLLLPQGVVEGEEVVLVLLTMTETGMSG